MTALSKVAFGSPLTAIVAVSRLPEAPHLSRAATVGLTEASTRRP